MKKFKGLSRVMAIIIVFSLAFSTLATVALACSCHPMRTTTISGGTITLAWQACMKTTPPGTSPLHEKTFDTVAMLRYNPSTGWLAVDGYAHVAIISQPYSLYQYDPMGATPTYIDRNATIEYDSWVYYYDANNVRTTLREHVDTAYRGEMEIMLQGWSIFRYTRFVHDAVVTTYSGGFSSFTNPVAVI